VDHSHKAGGNAKRHITLKKYSSVLQDKKMYLPYNSSSVLLGIHSREIENYDLTKACPQMFTAGLLVITEM
jgi:hypothetical protein